MNQTYVFVPQISRIKALLILSCRVLRALAPLFVRISVVMWHLKYTCRDKDGNKHVRHSLLDTETEYTLGRGQKNHFQVDKKTVSAVHLKFKIDPIEYPMRAPVLKLKLIGQTATIEDKQFDLAHLSKEERDAADYVPFTKTTVVKVSGVTLKFHNKLMLFKIKADCANKYDEGLRRMGIPYTTVYLPETTHLIKTEIDNSLDMLAALLSKIQIVKPKYIDALVDQMDLLKQDYDANLPNADNFLLSESCKPDSRRTEFLNDVAFVFFYEPQFRYMSPILEMANTKICMFDSNPTVEQIIKFVENVKISQTKIVLVQPELTDDIISGWMETMRTINEASKSLGMHLATNEDIFNAVLNIDYDTLNRKRPIKKPAALPEEESNPPKRKKRRGRVQALDSLDFFAGGKTQEKDVDMKENQSEESAPKVLIQEEIKDEEEPVPKKRRGRIKPLSNEMLNTELGSIPESNIDENPKVLQSPQSVIAETQQTQELNLSSKEEEEEKAEPITKQTTFLAAAQTTKAEANIRIENELGQIENIDATTIESMRDLAIIEKTNNVCSRHRKEPEASQEASTIQNQTNHNYWDPRWTGRKNFKTFVKVSKKSDGHGGNANFLQTHIRNYVPMDLVDVDQARRKGPDDELLESNERHNKRQREVENKRIPSTSLNQNGDSLKMPSSISMFNARTEPLFVQDYGSDSDEEVATFQFSTDVEGVHNQDGLGMSVRINEKDTDSGLIPEFRRVNANGVQGSAVQVLSRPVSSETANSRKRTTSFFNNDDDDDDDDDDDIPRFRFRS